MSDEAVEFVREQIMGWIGNLMRDLDAQETPITVDEVAQALIEVSGELTAKVDDQEFNDFLRSLNGGDCE